MCRGTATGGWYGDFRSPALVYLQAIIVYFLLKFSLTTSFLNRVTS
jgi:hypothetical protein